MRFEWYLAALVLGLWLGPALVYLIIAAPLYLLSGGSIRKLAVKSIAWPVSIFRLLFLKRL